ncbi:MAG: phytanoyl-CoA dioxygenase family protein [Alphaproteobacteria bacterium]|nr:phytanoyl-CoA dioxygenase family protein [Alphaproteobacteria bacterium]
MFKRLTVDQVEGYRRDGFLGAQPALTPAETAHYRDALEAFEAELGGPLTAQPPMFSRKLHIRFPWAAELVRHPAILDVIEDLIGPDILIYNATFFIKEAHTDGVAAWHQDSTYFGLDPHEHVSAWVALSDASAESGCMEFIPGSPDWGQLHHAAKAIPNSINLNSQTVVEDFKADSTVAVPLKAGEFSCHHTLVLHSSGPNKADDRRIGFGISYIPTHVRHKGTHRVPASLARGTDQYGHFEREPDGRDLNPAEAKVAHEAAFGGYRTAREEQMAWHVATYGNADA